MFLSYRRTFPRWHALLCLTTCLWNTGTSSKQQGSSSSLHDVSFEVEWYFCLHHSEADSVIILSSSYQNMFAALVPAVFIGAAAERGRILPACIFFFCWSVSLEPVPFCLPMSNRGADHLCLFRRLLYTMSSSDGFGLLKDGPSNTVSQKELSPFLSWPCRAHPWIVRRCSRLRWGRTYRDLFRSYWTRLLDLLGQTKRFRYSHLIVQTSQRFLRDPRWVNKTCGTLYWSEGIWPHRFFLVLIYFCRYYFPVSFPQFSLHSSFPTWPTSLRIDGLDGSDSTEDRLSQPT